MATTAAGSDFKQTTTTTMCSDFKTITMATWKDFKTIQMTTCSPLGERKFLDMAANGTTREEEASKRRRRKIGNTVGIQY